MKMTQNENFESVKIGGRMMLSGTQFWVLFFSLWVRQKLVAEWRNSGPDFVSRK